MINEENQIYLNDRSILLTNQGLHISPTGFCSIVITAQKLSLGRVIDSASIELNLDELLELIDCLEMWRKQFSTIKFVENKNE